MAENRGIIDSSNPLRVCLRTVIYALKQIPPQFGSAIAAIERFRDEHDRREECKRDSNLIETISETGLPDVSVEWLHDKFQAFYVDDLASITAGDIQNRYWGRHDMKELKREILDTLKPYLKKLEV